jgi:hypothetical protein
VPHALKRSHFKLMGWMAPSRHLRHYHIARPRRAEDVRKAMGAVNLLTHAIEGIVHSSPL